MEPKDTLGLLQPANEQRVARLPDGRSLGYAEFGDSVGAPVFVLHGNPGSRLEEITLPVTIWHGEADRNAPVATARYLAQTIPQSSLRTFAGEGHFSLLGRLAELVGVLTGK